MRSDWLVLPINTHKQAYHAKYHPRCGRPENPAQSAGRRPHEPCRSGRQGRPVAVALSAARAHSGKVRRHHALCRGARSARRRPAGECVHFGEAGKAEGRSARQVCQDHRALAGGSGMLLDDRAARLLAARGGAGSRRLRALPQDETDAARRHCLDRVEFRAGAGEVYERLAGGVLSSSWLPAWPARRARFCRPVACRQA